jgi:hypothetical protein
MTPIAPHEWSGDDWQEWCDLLFQARHAPAGYVRVPDIDRGDLGVEGYSVDGTGCMYQCYAGTATDLRKRYEDQRDKITTDLRKLVSNETRMALLLGIHRMRSWILVVPLHDSKELVFHARKKEDEMRGHALPFLDAHFTVVIQTDRQNFAAERKLMDAGAIAKVPSIAAPDDAMATAAVARLELDEAEQAATMDGKLRRASVGDPAAARDRLLRRVVDADNNGAVAP